MEWLEIITENLPNMFKLKQLTWADLKKNAVTGHPVLIPLTPGVLYYYKIESIDKEKTSASDEEWSFQCCLLGDSKALNHLPKIISSEELWTLLDGDSSGGETVNSSESNEGEASTGGEASTNGEAMEMKSTGGGEIDWEIRKAFMTNDFEWPVYQYSEQYPYGSKDNHLLDRFYNQPDEVNASLLNPAIFQWIHLSIDYYLDGKKCIVPFKQKPPLSDKEFEQISGTVSTKDPRHLEPVIPRQDYKLRGWCWHQNSCYLDNALFAMFVAPIGLYQQWILDVNLDYYLSLSSDAGKIDLQRRSNLLDYSVLYDKIDSSDQELHEIQLRQDLQTALRKNIHGIFNADFQTSQSFRDLWQSCWPVLSSMDHADPLDDVIQPLLNLFGLHDSLRALEKGFFHIRKPSSSTSSPAVLGGPKTGNPACSWQEFSVKPIDRQLGGYVRLDLQSVSSGSYLSKVLQDQFIRVHESQPERCFDNQRKLTHIIENKYFYRYLLYNQVIPLVLNRISYDPRKQQEVFIDKKITPDRVINISGLEYHLVSMIFFRPEERHFESFILSSGEASATTGSASCEPDDQQWIHFPNYPGDHLGFPLLRYPWEQVIEQEDLLRGGYLYFYVPRPVEDFSQRDYDFQQQLKLEQLKAPTIPVTAAPKLLPKPVLKPLRERSLPQPKRIVIKKRIRNAAAPPVLQASETSTAISTSASNTARTSASVKIIKPPKTRSTVAAGNGAVIISSDQQGTSSSDSTKVPISSSLPNRNGHPPPLRLFSPFAPKSRTPGVTRTETIIGDGDSDGNGLLSSFRDPLWTQYILNKPTSTYRLPTSPIKVMRGVFYYDYQTQTYRLPDPTGWWLSEKLDGIRCIWTGGELRTRNDRVIQAPSWWLDALPRQVALDGELYLGRKQFSAIQGIGHTLIPDPNLWKKVTFHIFDIPDANKLRYKEVHTLLQRLVQHLQAKQPQIAKYLAVVPQIEIKSAAHLLEQHREWVGGGAEGTMIRDPNSVYVPFQTDRLMKFKSQIDPNTGELQHLYDDNAIIIGYKLSDKWFKPDGQPGLKSLQVRWADAKEFDLNPNFSVSLKITKQEKCGDYQKLFPIGGEIRVLYNELFETQKPRYPRFGGLVKTTKECAPSQTSQQQQTPSISADLSAFTPSTPSTDVEVLSPATPTHISLGSVSTPPIFNWSE